MQVARACRGFTLVELLVALAALSLMAILSWRGIDVMLRSDEALRAQARQAQVLDAALGQWQADLDAAITLAGLPGMDWNGRIWRLLRRDSTDASRGVTVVAWTLRADPASAGSSAWIRWQAADLRTRGQVQQAWEEAAREPWQSPGAGLGSSVQVMPVSEWQLRFFSGGRWRDAPATPTEAVRLQLMLPASAVPHGALTVDWLAPQVAGARS